MGGGPKGDVVKYTKQAPGNDYDGGRAVAFGPNNNVYWTGYYASINTAFGGTNLPYPGGNGANAWDLFVVRYDEIGNHVWSKGWNGPLDQEPLAIAVDPNANIAIAGVMDGSANFDGHPITANAAEQDRIDAFVLKIVEQNGAPVVAWSAHFSGDQDEVAESVAFDAAGDVIVAGRVNGAVDFGGSCGVKGATGSHGMFLTKLDKTDGHCVWVKYYSGYTELVNKYGDQGKRLNLAIDPASGDILLAGGAINPNFGQGPIATFGEVDAFVVRLASDGTHKKSRTFFGEMSGADGAQHASYVALDRCGDIFITGSFTRSLTIGNDPFTVADVPNDAGLNEADKPDVFVAKLRGDTLEPLWAKAFGEAGDQQSFFVGADDLGNVLIAGRLGDDDLSTGIDFGGGKLVGPGPKPGEGYYLDLFALKLDPTGAHVWSRRWGTNGLEVLYSGAVGGGQLAITGLANSAPLDFGDGAQAINSDYFDGFLALLGP